MNEVPNLRGGIPQWMWALFPIVVSIAIAAAPAVIAVIHASDNPNRMQELARDVAKISQDFAVFKADVAGAAATRDANNALLNFKVDQLLKRKQ